MARYVVEYAGWTRRPTEEVEARDLRREGPWLVLEDRVLVIGLPRSVVALRVPAAEVAVLRRLR